ncbi:APG_G0031670.mRNA.1.CDS.1 [Saccharomyces cerevisiae]|nr:APG_G0031670.mRNA.1.CDS.1 [Saccharomyces cerevisiae]CAI7194031.1 APG_G0031670.mRNA.1.CDS.1 [Saccharomyces cerevisiae]
MLAKMVEHFGTTKFSGEDRLDDGSLIKLQVIIRPEKEEYIFNFDGTSPQVYGNLNAPEAITNSAILYCLRCLVGEDIPLNQGCLKPLTIKIPAGSLLSPPIRCCCCRRQCINFPKSDRCNLKNI